MSNIQLLPSVPNPGYYNPCSGALSMTLPQETVNLITEPSFEVYASNNWPAKTNWRIALHTGATVNPVTSYIVTGTQSYAGASSLYSRTISGNHVVSVAYASISVTSGYYAWSFYIRGDARSNGRSYVSTIRNSSTNAILASKQFALVENQWNRIELVWYSTSSISVTVGIEKNAVSGSFIGGDCWIDACQFEKLQVQNITGSTDGLRATTYFDGSTSGFYGSNAAIQEYVWRGQPHRSESVRSGQTNHGGRVINLQDQCALEIISINEAGMNQPTNHDGVFNTADGGQLVDIVNSKRTITMIGRVSGTDKNDFAQKMAQLTAYFSRDVTTMRTPRRFIFQHKDGRENVGVELTFFAAFESGLNATLSDAYVANVEISLAMYDPYFYGHDESMNMNIDNVSFAASNSDYPIYTMSSYIDSMYDSSAVRNTTWKRLGVNENIVLNSVVRAMAVDNDGIIWIGGDFTTINGVTHNRIATYNPKTKVWSQVLSGATNGVNNSVYDIRVAPDNKVWVAGQFTSAGGVANTAYFAYYNKATNTFVSPSTDQPNGPVYTISINVDYVINDFEIVIGGSFTTIGGVTRNRLAAKSAVTPTQYDPIADGSGNNGVNNDVYKVLYDTNSKYYYIGGAFTRIGTAGTVVNGIARYAQNGSLTSMGWGIFNASVLDIIADDDGNIVFAPISTGSTMQIRATGATTGVNATNANLCFYNGSVLQWWTVSTATVLADNDRNIMQNYKGGILFGNSNAWYWPGTATSATQFVAYNQPICIDNYRRHIPLVLADDTVFVASSDLLVTTNYRHASIVRGYNSSTVAANITLQAIGNNDLDLWQVINWSNSKMIYISQSPINNGLFFLTAAVLFSNKYDYISLDFKNTNLTTYLRGNVLTSIYSWSDILTFKIYPGYSYISLFDPSQTSSATPDAGVQQYSIYWPQTFQSIFDGVNKQ